MLECLRNALVLGGIGVGFLALPAVAGSYEDYFLAVKRDDARAVQLLLQRGFDPNTPDPSNLTGLLIALREPSPKVAKVLLSAPGIDVNVATADGETPLMLAVFREDMDLVQQLLVKDADVNKVGWTPLHYAAARANLPLIKLMLERHAYIDAESPNKTTPLMMAAHYGNAAAVKLLLDEGADPNLKNDLGMTAIDFANQANRQDSADVISAFIRARQPKGRW